MKIKIFCLVLLLFSFLNNYLENYTDYNLIEKSTRFFYRDVYKIPFIVAIQDSEKSIKKLAFSLLGFLISEVLDIKDLNLDTGDPENKKVFIKERVMDKLSINFDHNNTIISKQQFLNLKPIKRDEKLESITNLHEDNKLGVIDLETFKDTTTGTTKVYACGVYTYLDEDPTIFYIDKSTLDDKELVLKFINFLCKPSYKDITFYCHNFGNYDVYFILNT
jgi:hypothetical protein